MNDACRKWWETQNLYGEYAAELAWNASRRETLDEVWGMLRDLPCFENPDYGFKLLNRRQILGSVNEMYVKASKEV